MRKLVEHVITGLNIGGAELILSKLASNGAKFDHAVTSLAGNGLVGESLLRKGVAVTNLSMRKDPRILADYGRLVHGLRERSPVIVQTWLYHADLLGGLAARRAGIPVIWNLRQTEVARGAHKVTTAFAVRICAALSKRLPVGIVCGSNAALASHDRMGFDVRKMVVIRNGVDTGLFKPDPAARVELRRSLGIGEDVPLVGRIGRFHPQKDYRGFLEAARRVAERRPDVHFLLAGENVTWANADLARWIAERGLDDKCCLMDRRIDIEKIIASLDLLVSSSVYGEGFPNVVAEGMACEIPCVATDVGDSAELIRDEQRIVGAGDYNGLADAVCGLLALEREQRRRIGALDRERVAKHFDIGGMISNYETLYERSIAGGHKERSA